MYNANVLFLKITYKNKNKNKNKNKTAINQ